MAKTVKLEIVTPDRSVLSEDVEYVGAPGVEGEFGILPSHVPFLSALGIGNLHYQQNGKTEYVFIAGGFAEVSNDKVTILAEVAEKAAEIDTTRAQKAKDRAEARSQSKEKMDNARNQVALQRAIARLGCCK